MPKAMPWNYSRGAASRAVRRTVLFLATLSLGFSVVETSAASGGTGAHGVLGAVSESPAARLGLADLVQPMQIVGQQMALLQVAPRLDERLPTLLDMVQPVLLTGPKASDLPWWSGMACPNAGAAGTWRGQPFDTGWAGIGKRTWSSAISGAKSSSVRASAQAAPQPVIHLHLLPQEAEGQLAPCAAGAFDQKFRDIGTALKNNEAGHAVIRLGKEANRGRAAYGYTSYSQKDSYIGCFQRASAALKAGSPQLKIEWTNGRKTLNPVNPAEFYPGDKAVDIIGVHYYDNPELGRMTTQEIWDRLYVQNNPGGGPQGLGLWLALAKDKGKPLSISEWGVWGRDNPFYIEKMFEFFKKNAANLAYESYFNCADHHKIYPVGKFPKASAKYKELWSKG